MVVEQGGVQDYQSKEMSLTDMGKLAVTKNYVKQLEERLRCRKKEFQEGSVA